jgi:hypothetical protein
MTVAGMTTGCWIIQANNNCYCRSGDVTSGGALNGGSCP